MPEISATEAARKFSDLLDAVEHRHERFTVVRRGRVVAQISPMAGGRGANLKELLRTAHRDSSWASELNDLRGLVRIDERS
jgi:prevent-host-death family protein